MKAKINLLIKILIFLCTIMQACAPSSVSGFGLDTSEENSASSDKTPMVNGCIQPIETFAFSTSVDNVIWA